MAAFYCLVLIASIKIEVALLIKLIVVNFLVSVNAGFLIITNVFGQ